MTPTEKLLKLADSLTWQDIESLKHNDYVLLYSEKGFFAPNEKYQIGTREQWHLTATKWMPIPSGKAGEVIRILVEGLQNVHNLNIEPTIYVVDKSLQRAAEAMGEI